MGSFRSLSLTHQYAAVRIHYDKDSISAALWLTLTPLLGFALGEDGYVYPVLAEGDGLLAYAVNDDDSDSTIGQVPGFMGYVDIAASDSEVFDVLLEGLSDPHHVARVSAWLAMSGYKPRSKNKKASKKKAGRKIPFKLTRDMLLEDGLVQRDPAVRRAYRAARRQ